MLLGGSQTIENPPKQAEPEQTNINKIQDNRKAKKKQEPYKNNENE
jgi:hypothetical protein